MCGYLFDWIPKIIQQQVTNNLLRCRTLREKCDATNLNNGNFVIAGPSQTGLVKTVSEVIRLANFIRY